MKPIIGFFCGIALVCAGCGQPTPAPAPESTPGQSSALPPASMPSPEADVPPPPAPPGVEQKAPTGGTAPTPVAAAKGAIDFATSDRPVDNTGRPLSDLEWLNQIVLGYLMQATMPSAEPPKGTFQSQDEEIAAQAAAMNKQQKSMELRDLSDLVKAGVIKAIPAAPPGKRYVFDQKAGQVLLVGQ